MSLPGYCFNTNSTSYPLSTRIMVGGMSKKKKSRPLKNKKKKSRTFKKKNKKKKVRTFKNKYNRKLINTRSKRFSKKIKKQKGGGSLFSHPINAVKNVWTGLKGGDNYSVSSPWSGHYNYSYL